MRLSYGLPFTVRPCFISSVGHNENRRNPTTRKLAPALAIHNIFATSLPPSLSILFGGTRGETQGNWNHRERRGETDDDDDVDKMISSFSRSGASEGARRRGKWKKADPQAVATVAEERMDASEEEAIVEAFRKALIDRNLLPPRHDDYHTLLRSVSIVDLVPTISSFFHGSHFVHLDIVIVG
ncbi:hypothetical protein GW17_00049332 [Ensete ventricosum]|nr:hypothetical protein GW17_00049332 [Ensete ventricosum]RZS01215.1 hypothetical protein BHM03_00031029 [Ensete ventricosum]